MRTRAAFRATVTIARCFAFVGPYLPLDSGFAVGNFIRDALTTREIVVWRRLTQAELPLRRGHGSLALDHRGLWPVREAVQRRIGSGGLRRRPRSSDRHLGRSRRAVRILGDSSRVGAGGTYVPVVERARTELGLAVSVPLDAAIRRTIAWHRQSILHAAPDKE